MRISNGVDDFIACLRRRARRYRAQAAKQGGHFAAVILEGGRSELRLFGGAIRPGVINLDFLCFWVRLFLVEVYSLMVVKKVLINFEMFLLHNVNHSNCSENSTAFPSPTLGRTHE